MIKTGSGIWLRDLMMLLFREDIFLCNFIAAEYNKILVPLVPMVEHKGGLCLRKGHKEKRGLGKMLRQNNVDKTLLLLA
jgi:hypothetical protein